jgi:hypothetical protein
MAEDEDLQLLRATRPPQQPHQREQVPDNEIHKRPEQAASLDHDKSAEPSETRRSGEPRTSLRTLRADGVLERVFGNARERPVDDEGGPIYAPQAR